MAKAPQPRWWEARRANNLKPSTYTCPLCRRLLPALSEHMLLFPEGDHSRRRHAHTACVMQARNSGRLPTRQEWEKAQGPKARDEGSRRPAWLARLLGRSGGPAGGR
jgi:hypothetical protein